MNSKERVLIVVVLLTLCCTGLAGEQMNILMIVSEDNGPELSCYGDPYVKTPVLDALAKEGVRFTRAHVPQAGCSQSRAALLTGLFPHQNGQIGLATWGYRMYRKDTPNMVRSLKAAGYRTGIIGKLHVNPESAFPFDFKAIGSSNFRRHSLAKYAKSALQFFTAGDKPFFLSINYPDAHRPFIPVKNGMPTMPLKDEDVKTLPFIGLDTPGIRKQTANYYNCMMRLDSLIGKLLKNLKASGKYENTLIVYFGDHGAPMLRGKCTIYDAGTRVPLIVRAPGGKADQVRNELVSTLDLFPTFLEFVGVKPVAALPGQSLMPIIRGETPKWRTYLHTEYHLHSNHNYYPQRAVRNDRYKLIENLQPGVADVSGYAFATNRHFGHDFETALSKAPVRVREAYALLRRAPKYQLYDLAKDPYEFNNLAGKSEYEKVQDELSAELTRWRKATNDPMLDPRNVIRLKAEIEATYINGEYTKKKGPWEYPDYFFKEARNERPK